MCAIVRSWREGARGRRVGALRQKDKHSYALVIEKDWGSSLIPNVASFQSLLLAMEAMQHQQDAVNAKRHTTPPLKREVVSSRNGTGREVILG